MATVIPWPAGDLVIGGTINGTGTLRFTATRVGADATLSQIIAPLEEAQTSPRSNAQPECSWGRSE